MSRSLYICYFGLREPLVQTQVIPYLRELIKDGHEISLLTFEPAGAVTDVRYDLAEQGIDWYWLRYHKRLSVLATAYDLFRGALFVRGMIGRKKLDILHGRVHLPTLMGAVARKFSRRKPKLLFDIRGFFPEEYTDAGIWPENGWLYRGAKRVERWLLGKADGFVVLTEKARDILFPESLQTGRDKVGRPVEVIPCCVDFDRRFDIDVSILREEWRDRLTLNGRYVFTHVGALGGLYLTEKIVDFLKAARERDERTFAMFLTQSDKTEVLKLLQGAGFTESDYMVEKAMPVDVPGYLCASDVGLSFVKAAYSTMSRSPTKIPEYLASGLPIISNAGVGDVDELLAKNGIGAVVDSFDREGYLRALDGLGMLGNISGHCRLVAREYFDLSTVGGRRYRRIYKRLVK